MRNEDKLPSMETIQNRLHDGDVIANYKALCSLLEIPYLGGKSKDYQMAYLSRCFSFEKKGQAFIITQVFDEIEPQEKSLRSDAVYERVIEINLLEYLRACKDKNAPCIHTYRQWFEILGMVNNKYCHDAFKPNISHPEITAPVILAYGTKNGMTAEELNIAACNFNYYAFFARTSNRYRTNLRRILNNLENKRHIIHWRKVYMIYDGNDVHKANDAEIRLINDVYQEVFDLFGIKSEDQIYRRSQQDVIRFYNSINSHARKKFNLQYIVSGFYSAIEIIFSDKFLDQQIEYSYKKLDEVIAARNELNCKCYELANKNAITYYNNLTGDKKEWYSLATQKDLADYYILLSQSMD